MSRPSRIEDRLRAILTGRNPRYFLLELLERQPAAGQP
jgi:hypothetical protein